MLEIFTARDSQTHLDAENPDDTTYGVKNIIIDINKADNVLLNGMPKEICHLRKAAPLFFSRLTHFSHDYFREESCTQSPGS